MTVRPIEEKFALARPLIDARDAYWGGGNAILRQAVVRKSIGIRHGIEVRQRHPAEDMSRRYATVSFPIFPARGTRHRIEIEKRAQLRAE